MEDVRGFSSRIVDLRSIPPDSASRIAALLTARRARAAAEAAAAVSQEQVVASVGLDEVESEERLGRESLCKGEQKGFDWIQRQIHDALHDIEASFHQYQKLSQLESQRNKRVGQLQQTILRESFWNFSNQQQNNGVFLARQPGSPGFNASPVRGVTIDDATRVLGALYEPCMVPFAADPEECWKRGVTIHPSLQKPVLVQSPDKKRVEKVRPYCELADTLRQQYQSRGVVDAWWLRTPTSTTPNVGRGSTGHGGVAYKSTPMATLAHNYPYHLEPED